MSEKAEEAAEKEKAQQKKTQDAAMFFDNEAEDGDNDDVVQYNKVVEPTSNHGEAQDAEAGEVGDNGGDDDVSFGNPEDPPMPTHP